jgi:hypothetical protein
LSGPRAWSEDRAAPGHSATAGRNPMARLSRTRRARRRHEDHEEEIAIGIRRIRHRSPRCEAVGLTRRTSSSPRDGIVKVSRERDTLLTVDLTVARKTRRTARVGGAAAEPRGHARIVVDRDGEPSPSFWRVFPWRALTASL